MGGAILKVIEIVAVMRMLALFFVVCCASPVLAQTPITVDVPMRDGVLLKTDVWLPAVDGGTGRFPTLLRRTPYGRAIAADNARGSNNLGYAVVSQDVRGRGGSGGSFLPFFPDADDGSDTLAWIAAQSWSDGKVGTWSGSAEGIVQLMAAGAAPAALKCAFVVQAQADVYNGLFPGGAWRTELTSTWLTNLGHAEIIDEWKAHDARDGYWNPARLSDEEIALVDVPILHIGGFYDIFSDGTVNVFRRLQAGGSQDARDKQFMVMGPWTHGGLGIAAQGELTYPPDSAYFEYVADFIWFFDWCLKGAPQPSFAPVRYYVSRISDDGISATGQWRTEQHWPPPSTPVVAYLHDDRVLRASPPDADGSTATIPSDPNDPVPSVGGSNLTTPAGPRDQATVDARDDVITTTSAVGDMDVELAGDVTARIWAASASTDVDVVVRVSDVTPSGKVLLLTDGIRRGRFAGGLDAVRPLTPGVPVPFDVNLGPVAATLGRGHALRVSISATSSPRYEPNPGTAEPLASATPRVTTMTLYRDSAHPSAITLPIVRGQLPGLTPVDAGPPDAGLEDSGQRPDGGLDAGGAHDADGAPDAGEGGAPRSTGCDCATGPTKGKSWLLAAAAGMAVFRRRQRTLH